MNLIISFFSAINAAIVSFCERFMAPILQPVFQPINNALASIQQPWYTIVAIAFFVGTMIWVGALLNKNYVNLGRPKETWYTDLRLWVVASMLPHVFVYFYFY